MRRQGEALRNHMLGAGQQSQQAYAHPRIGLVSSYDPDTGAVKVKLQPGGEETGWLPIQTAWAGDGWGMGFGPSIDDQAVCVFEDGSLEAGKCVGFIHSDVDRPLGVPAGEAWLVSEEGASIKVTKPGVISIVTPSGQPVNITAPGGLHVTADTTITGNLVVSGDVTDTHGANNVTVKQLRDAYDAHKHTGVTTGSGVTGTTDHPVP